MKSRWITLFWGLVMIAAGAVFLLDAQGIINLNLISLPVMALIFGALSAFLLSDLILCRVFKIGVCFSPHAFWRASRQ